MKIILAKLTLIMVLLLSIFSYVKFHKEESYNKISVIPIFTDKETNCQYFVYNDRMMPRFDNTGKQICTDIKPIQ
jgi:hypothetical protein